MTTSNMHTKTGPGAAKSQLRTYEPSQNRSWTTTTTSEVTSKRVAASRGTPFSTLQVRRNRTWRRTPGIQTVLAFENPKKHRDLQGPFLHRSQSAWSRFHSHSCHQLHSVPRAIQPLCTRGWCTGCQYQNQQEYSGRATAGDKTEVASRQAPDSAPTCDPRDMRKAAASRLRTDSSHSTPALSPVHHEYQLATTPFREAWRYPPTSPPPSNAVVQANAAPHSRE
mmetsp:Transcript_108649/g.249049  ORF Transcript_108649/g.249049 Transcript_108649/m.249049 type:complete len:224 (+) Transcript_108649:545-1216(+)